MNIKTDLPRTIREIEHVWIPMSDGARLAARIWLPEDAEHNPVPAILEYIPYRKNDATALFDSTRHPYFAGHGYAAVRVDMRGSGDADGILYDEYLPQEQLDAVEVIAWLAQQPWCTGSVGMMGISWGGFNSLQVAARRPPALKAIITVCSTDDRYADDVHYMGGCVLGSDMLWWASTMFAYNARPPDPKVVGENWRERWIERMEKSPPFIETWLTHQRRDAYWKHGSVCETYSRPDGAAARDITCAVYAVGGWTDGYTNAIPRLLEGLICPRKGLIGPWAHAYPELAEPGPAIGFLQEALRWWDHWLKSVDNGVMDEPMLRAWMMESVPPSANHREWPGRWVAEREWPSTTITPQTYNFDDEHLTRAGSSPHSAEATAPATIRGAEACGMEAAIWCPYGVDGEYPPDQRAEDGRSLCFTSAPLAERMETLGFPEVTLTVASDQPNALLAVRLCDVSPGGSSLLVSRGLLNLTHRESHESPTPLEPGWQYTVTLRLNAIGHAIPAGHRWRVAVSPTYWPHAWPSPAPVTLTVFGGALSLPVRPLRVEDTDLPPFGPAEVSAPLEIERIRSRTRERTARHDVARGLYEIVDPMDHGHLRLKASGVEHGRINQTTYRIVEGDPLSAEVTCEWRIAIGRGDWQTRVETKSVMTADATHFRVTNVLDAYEGNVRVFGKSWNFSVPRDLV